MTQTDEEAVRQILGSQVQADAKDAETFVAKHIATIDDQGNDNAEDLRFAFLAGIAHEREKHRWISVKERLPTPYASVLACEDNPEMACIVCYWDDRCGGWMDTIEQNSVGKVTHWMPLPEPPGEE